MFVIGLYGIGPSFGPSRHILFAASVAFLVYGFGVDFAINRVRINRTVGSFVLSVVICMGFGAFFVRMSDAKDKTDLIHVDSDVSNVFIDGCHVHLLYKTWGSAAKPKFVEASDASKLKIGGTYLIVSQDIENSVQKYLENWSDGPYALHVLDHQLLNTGVQFLAYSPKQYAWDRPSGFESITFQVNPR